MIKDHSGKLSMMRLSHLVCMIIAVLLTFAAIAAAFVFKMDDYSTFLNNAVIFAGIGTAGKTIQKDHHNAKQS